MPLSLAETGKEYEIIRLGGSAEVKQHLADLGFHVGGTIVVVSKNGNDLIVKVKEARVALGRDLVNKIFI